ncbi:MAG TPA: hypothetical protein VFU06_08120 [Longimicrobiales bacterium]|nr:hypothetical protein [Longimicrobiales bacterium]
MRSQKTGWKLSMILAVLVACSGTNDDADASATPSSTPAARPAAQSASTQRSDAPTFAETHASYRLTMPEVRRWYEAQANIYRAMETNPDLIDRIDMSNVDASSVDDLEAHFDGIPEVRDAVEDAGLDMNAYAAILVTLTHAVAMDAVIQDGHADRASVIANRDVSEANLELVEKNRAELERLEQELEELGM